MAHKSHGGQAVELFFLPKPTSVLHVFENRNLITRSVDLENDPVSGVTNWNCDCFPPLLANGLQQRNKISTQSYVPDNHLLVLQEALG